MVAFVVSACITILASVFKGLCLVTIQKHDNPFRRYILPHDHPRWGWLTEQRAEFWNDILGQIILGLADQQMVTGFAILVSGFHTYDFISAYHFYIVAHVAAFSCLTQSMAILVIFDIIHRSLILHAMRVLVYSITLGLFYAAAFLSFDLTGPRGYRASCPATCKFKSAEGTFVGVVLAGLPVYAFIIFDLIRKALQRYGILETDDFKKRYRRPPGIAGFQLFRSIAWRYGFQTLRLVAWLYTIGDLGVGLYSVWTSWWIKSYQGLALESNFDQMSWGFGQLVAVILISLPFLSAIEMFKGMLPSFTPTRERRNLTSSKIKWMQNVKRRSKRGLINILRAKTSPREIHPMATLV